MHTVTVDRLVDGAPDDFAGVVETQVGQEVGTGAEHGDGVGRVCADEFRTGVSRRRLKDGVLRSVVSSGQNAGPANEPADEVGDDGAVLQNHQR